VTAAIRAKDAHDGKASLRPEGIDGEQWLAHIRGLVGRAEDSEQDLSDRLASLAEASRAVDAFFLVRSALPYDDPARRDESPAFVDVIPALADRCALAFARELVPALHDRGVVVSDPRDLEGSQRGCSEELFTKAIFPLLTPMSVDSGRPFPYIANLSLNIAALIENSKGRPLFVRIEVPQGLPRWLRLGEDSVFIAVEELIADRLHQILHGGRARAHYAFRVTRQLALEKMSEASTLAAVSLRRGRPHASPPVRLEVEAAMPRWLVEFLIDRVGVSESRTYAVRGPLDLSRASDLVWARVAHPHGGSQSSK
jgi:polyphosphate kinase